MPRKPKVRAPFTSHWTFVSERDQGRVVDLLIHGNNGALTAMRTCKMYLEREPPRRDLAEKALRRAGVRYAAIRRLGYELEGVEDELAELAARFDLVVI